MDYCEAWKTKDSLVQYLIQDKVGEGAKQTVERYKVKGDVLWTVERRDYSNGSPSEKYIVGYVMKRSRKYGWGYIDIPETAGPLRYTCPVEYFDEVPEPDSEYSKDWREKCRKFADRSK